ncbi:hypothetical protein WA158_004755 [Blastocystis sp. Blastoise]
MFRLSLFIIASLILCQATASSNFETLSKLKKNGIVTLNDDQYQEYILRQRRDFDAFVLYTVLSSRYHCGTCRNSNTEFNLLASCYDKMENPENNILFIRVLHENAPRVFKYHEFESIPNFAFIPRTLHINKKLPEDNMMNHNVEGALRAEHYASFIRSKLALNILLLFEILLLLLLVYSIILIILYIYIYIYIPIYRFPWPQVIISCVFIFGLPLAAYLYLFKAENIYKIVGHKFYYLVLCLMVYALAVSGLIYDIIKEPPFMYCTQQGCEVFSRNGQGQFVLEGLITGVLNIACCMAVLYLIEFGAKPGKENKGEYINTAVLVFITLFLIYTFCYIVKNPWYISVLKPRGN